MGIYFLLSSTPCLSLCVYLPLSLSRIVFAIIFEIQLNISVT